MDASYTARQGQFLSFIHGYSVKHGYAPSSEEIGAHFGITPPSVSTMIKTLEQRGLLSRLPYVARSLRVLVPAAALPSSEFGPHSKGEARRRTQSTPASCIAPEDSAAAAAIAVIDVLMPPLLAQQERRNGAFIVRDAAQAVHKALIRVGLSEQKASAVARLVTSEAARWEPEGKGTIIHKWHWVRE